jgi:DNA-binding Lrp family transcriptional regulator
MVDRNEILRNFRISMSEIAQRMGTLEVSEICLLSMEPKVFKISQQDCLSRMTEIK